MSGEMEVDIKRFKMNIKGTRCEDVDWIYLAWDRVVAASWMQ
jgi:hypothetical protein